MNNLSKYLLFLIPFFLCTSFDFTFDKSKILVRDWQLVNLYTPRIERNFKASGMSPERREQIMKAWVDGSYLKFSADGTYQVSILGSEPDTMYWQLSDDDTMLFVKKTQAEDPKTIDIELLTKKDLIIVLPDQDGEYTRMYFKSEDGLEASDGSD